MQDYYINYNHQIEPLYGNKRNYHIDSILLENNLLPHKYCIIERLDMTSYDVYSIDPDGCEDADDAFSIYKEDDKLFLAIHIADPTEFINKDSTLWISIENKIVTRYPSNTKPIHMMPEEIMEKASLMVNRFGEIKLAITVLTEIDINTFKPIGNARLMFTKIKVNKNNALNYKQAGELLDNNFILSTGKKISGVLMSIRGEKTKGIVLNEVDKSNIKFKNDNVYLYNDSPEEKSMKQMIAEFAIFANSFVGEYLKINFEGLGLYRICDASDWLHTLYDGITGEELLNEIIVSGISAEYISKVDSHDLVGSPEYCHFTSPIRRLSDCVCHYLLKYIYLKNKIDIEVPFSNDDLVKYSNSCMRLSKSMKNLQYKDTKFRLIQVMHNMLSNKENVTISYFISSYTGLFLNIIIEGINEHSIYLSYTLRITKLNTNFETRKKYTLNVTKVNCIGKYDQGSIPELDSLFL
jgi:exoribonuclease R